ncbi:MAG: hypothetical protein JRF48_05020 [Deltaproteobacteria bacterium]|nr:hypothetical protein [Deltaproteobacteria bacterium]
MAYIQAFAGFFGTVATVVVFLGVGVTLKLISVPGSTQTILGLIGFMAAFVLMLIVGLAMIWPRLQSTKVIVSQLLGRGGGIYDRSAACIAQAVNMTLIGNAKRIFLFIVITPLLKCLSIFD